MKLPTYLHQEVNLVAATIAAGLIGTICRAIGKDTTRRLPFVSSVRR